MPFKTFPLLSIFLVASASAYAAGKIGYGSRAGMDVSVISMSGLDTANAVIVTKHAPEDAAKFCRDYLANKTKKCAEETLADTRLNDRITANCRTGEFIDFYGDKHQFLGPNKKINGEFCKVSYSRCSNRGICERFFCERIFNQHGNI